MHTKNKTQPSSCKSHNDSQKAVVRDVAAAESGSISQGYLSLLAFNFFGMMRRSKKIMEHWSNGSIVAFVVVILLFLASVVVTLATEEMQQNQLSLSGLSFEGHGASAMRFRSYANSESAEMAYSEATFEPEAAFDDSFESFESVSESLGGMVLDSIQANEEELPEKQNSLQSQMLLVHKGTVAARASRKGLDKVADRIALLAKKHGGFVESHSSNRPYGKGQLKSIEMQLRIASDKFQDAISALKDLIGEENITSISSSTKDITEKYIDSTSRGKTLAASRDVLQILLRKAESVTEVMAVQRELSEITQKYERAMRKALYLKNKSELSSLSVFLEETRGEKNQEETFQQKIYKTMLLAWKHMLNASLFTGNVMVYTAVWAIPMMAIVTFFTILSNRMKA